jgi:hypothetical protein
MNKKIKPKRYYLNLDANANYVSKRPLNKEQYHTPTILHCIPTKKKRITKEEVFVGAICVTIDNEVLEIVKIKQRKLK